MYLAKISCDNQNNNPLEKKQVKKEKAPKFHLWCFLNS